jgi:anaerobic magnesium-protoporphyrin IX monomethyl ester cyclase
LLYLAAALRGQSHYRVSIVDLGKQSFQATSPEAVFENDDARIFGITSTTYTRIEAIAIARAIRRLHPDSLIVAGGVHFMHAADDTLLHVAEIDIVVRGEGELTIVEIADAVRTGRSWHDIKGIAYLRDGAVINNPPQDRCIDLDGLPFQCEQYSWDEYPEYLYGVKERIKAASLMSSRGCPYECIFCAKQDTGYRTRNAKAVVDEVEALQSRFAVDAVNFLDLSLTASPRHVIDLCHELRDRGLGIVWWCESRASMPLDLLEEMKMAGCASVAIGVESGSARILSRLRKRITPEQVMSFCKKASRLGISVQCYFMYSHPEETVADVMETIDFMSALGDFALCTIQPTMVFPGTEIELLARAKGLIPADFSWSLPYESSLGTELGQLSNCPLYVEAISPDFMRRIQPIVTEMTMSKAYAEQSVWQILLKAYRHFAVNRRPVPDYVTWSFLKRYVEKKGLQRKKTGRNELYED